MSEVIDLWNQAWAEEKGDTDLTNARVGGRKSKDKPNKEDVAQWHKQGPQWVADYINWRKSNPNYEIWRTPEGVPAIELTITVDIAGLPVKMGIDRVFDVGGQLVVTDLKTSQQEPKSGLQLGFYKYGLDKKFGLDVKWGNYFMARKAGTSGWVDLSWYSHDKIEHLVGEFDRARKAGIFLPNANNCFLCGLKEFCIYKGSSDAEVSD